MKVLVLGGNGFIGRQVAASLRMQGAQVTVGSRMNPQNRADDIVIRMQNMQKASGWEPLLVCRNGQAKYDRVVNCVGILRERGFGKNRETYETIHTQAPGTLALACAKLGIRLIHISALGLSLDAKSRFIRSKYLGEQAILVNGAPANIVRVPLLDGEGGYGARWFRRVAAWPVQLVMKSGGLVAPMQVTDLGEAIANLCVQPEVPQIVEFGGSETLSIPDYLHLLRKRSGRGKALQISVSPTFVRLASHLFDVIGWTPLSFGHFELMQGYNVPAYNFLPELLGREPLETGVITTRRSPVFVTV